MDPYVVVKKGLHKLFRTKTHKEAGQLPKWYEEVSIPFDSIKDELLLQVFDENMLVDDLIG